MTTTSAGPVRHGYGWRKHVYRAFALMLSFGIACGMAEIALRLAGYDLSYVCPLASFCQREPVLGWQGKPNFVGRWRQGEFDISILHDENGFRKQEYQKEPSQVESTVYVLGDSFVWGYGADQGKNLTDRLNLLLPNRQVENFGLAGCGTIHEYVIFEKYVQQRMRSGDTVLLAFFGNDFTDNVGTDPARLHAELQDGEMRLVPPASHSTPEEWIHTMKDYSYLLNLVVYCTDRFQGLWRQEKMTGRPQSSPAGATEAEPVLTDECFAVQATQRYLARFKKACEEKHVRFVVAYVTSQVELDEDDFSVFSPPEWLGYQKAFFRCADRLGIETIDLLPQFLQAKKTGRCERLTYRYDFHWNEDAHAIAAEVISARLFPQNHAGLTQAAARRSAAPVK